MALAFPIGPAWRAAAGANACLRYGFCPPACLPAGPALRGAQKRGRSSESRSCNFAPESEPQLRRPPKFGAGGERERGRGSQAEPRYHRPAARPQRHEPRPSRRASRGARQEVWIGDTLPAPVKLCRARGGPDVPGARRALCSRASTPSCVSPLRRRRRRRRGASAGSHPSALALGTWLHRTTPRDRAFRRPRPSPGC